MDRFNRLRKKQAKHKRSFIKACVRIFSFVLITSFIYFFISDISFTKFVENDNLFLQTLISVFVNLFTTLNLIIVVATIAIYFYSTKSIQKKVHRLALEILTANLLTILFTSLIILMFATTTVSNHLVQSYNELDEEEYSTNIGEIRQKLQSSQVNTEVKIGVDQYYKEKISDSIISYNNSVFQNGLFTALINKSSFKKRYNINNLFIGDSLNKNILVIDDTFNDNVADLLPIVAITLIEDRYGNFYKEKDLPVYTFVESSSEAKRDIEKELDNSYRRNQEMLDTKLKQVPLGSPEYNRLSEQKKLLDENLILSKSRISKDINVLGYFIEPNKVKVIAVTNKSKSSNLLGVTIHETLHYLSSKEPNDIHPFFDEGITQHFTQTLVPQYSQSNIYAEPVKEAKSLEAVIGEEELALIYFSKDNTKLEVYLNQYFGSNYILNNAEKLNSIFTNEVVAP